MPQYLKLRDPSRDTVLYPAISYPTYEMGATLAGCRAVPYLRLDDIADDDAARALCVWVNSPAQPDRRAARPRRRRGVGPRARRAGALGRVLRRVHLDRRRRPRSCASGTAGVLAVHSLSKRDNFAGARIGFYAGDAELVHYLREVRKHAGLMPPGPVQAAAVVALGDDAHVEVQRERYLRRLHRLRRACSPRSATPAELPDGAFYLWVAGARTATPGPPPATWPSGPASSCRPASSTARRRPACFRVAAVQPDERIALAAARVGACDAP